MTASWPYYPNVNSALTAITVAWTSLQSPRSSAKFFSVRGWIRFSWFRSRSSSIVSTSVPTARQGSPEKNFRVPCPRVQVGGLLHPSLCHGRHPQANVHEDGAKPHVLGEARLRLQAVPAAHLEVGAFVAYKAEQVVPVADNERGWCLAIGGDDADRHQRIDLVRRQSIGAARQYPLREDPVDGQRIGIATLPVAREAVGPLPDRLVERGRLLGLQRQAENDAVQEREPRIPLQDLRGQEPVGRDQPAVARPQPQRVGADAFDQLADQPAIARRARMAPRRRQIVPAGQRERDPPVQGALAGRVFDREQTDAVVPEHRVHAPHGAVWVGRHQQPIQRRHRGNPHPGVARSEHLVHEIVIEPVEDRQIEQAGAIRRRQVAQQPHADVVQFSVSRSASAPSPFASWARMLR